MSNSLVDKVAKELAAMKWPTSVADQAKVCIAVVLRDISENVPSFRGAANIIAESNGIKLDGE
jgi:hypothetical protein